MAGRVNRVHGTQFCNSLLASSSPMEEGWKKYLPTHHHDGNTNCHAPAAAFQTNPGGCAEAP